MAEEFIPIVLFIMVGIVLVALFWFRYKTRAELQQTVRNALERGVELSPELIDRLGAAKPPKGKDLRLGVIWMSIALALLLCALAIQEPDALPGILAAAAFPFSIGLAYLLLWAVISRHDVDAD